MRFEIEVVNESGALSTATIETSGGDGVCTLAIELEGRRYEATSSDYFDALVSARRPVEASGLRLLCYGASRSCYPSPMARDMGQGLSVYRLTPGRQAEAQGLVPTFASGPDVEPASVEEQKTFYRQWLASLR